MGRCFDDRTMLSFDAGRIYFNNYSELSSQLFCSTTSAKFVQEGISPQMKKYGYANFIDALHIYTKTHSETTMKRQDHMPTKAVIAD